MRRKFVLRVKVGGSGADNNLHSKSKFFAVQSNTTGIQTEQGRQFIRLSRRGLELFMTLVCMAVV